MENEKEKLRVHSSMQFFFLKSAFVFMKIRADDTIV